MERMALIMRVFIQGSRFHESMQCRSTFLPGKGSAISPDEWSGQASTSLNRLDEPGNTHGKSGRYQMCAGNYPPVKEEAWFRG